MFFAIFGLGPPLMAILAAVCSVRLGICALHGQLLYFLTLLLFSFFALGPNMLWGIPVMACLAFACGTVAALFMVRKNFNLDEGKPRLIGTGLLILLNLVLMLVLMHNLLGIMCLRFDQGLPEWAGRLLFMIKVGSAALLVWMLVFCLLGLRRVGLCAFYAICGLIFTSYLIMSAYAQPDGSLMPPSLSAHLAKKLTLAYQAIPLDAVIPPALATMPPLVALLCAACGFTLLAKGQGRKKAPKPAPLAAQEPTSAPTAPNHKPGPKMPAAILGLRQKLMPKK